MKISKEKPLSGTHFTREQYMNKDVSHHDYYSQFVTESTKKFVLSSLKVQDIKESIEGEDIHLNKIKIPFNNMGRGGGWWWDDTPFNVNLLKKLGGTNCSAAATSVGKAAARILVQEYNNNKDEKSKLR